MKKFLVAVAISVMTIVAHAEASFDQIEGLIQQQNYSAAAAGLETIIQNHPKSAKAFYAMAQAQAGLGNLEKARKALDIATGLNPTLDFAPVSSVQSLRQAITPQTAKIEAVSESHTLRNFVYFVLFAGFGVACYFMWSVYSRKQEEEEAARKKAEDELRVERESQDAKRKQEWAEMTAKQEEERKATVAAEEALKSHKNYNHERFDPANPDKLKSVAQFKKEQAEAARVLEMREAQARAEDEARRARSSYYSTPYPSQPASTTTVVNNGSSSGDLAMGMMLGSMMSNNGHHHDTERTVIHETVREVPAKDSSWNDAPAKSSSRSSSWDDDSSSKSRSSWSSSSDSSSSSSWDSSSSSSDSSSSSSWD